MKEHFEQFAAYNRYANARLYGAAFALEESDYFQDVGAFFKSMHGTLNHLLLTDRIWMKRLTGEGDHPNELDAILHRDRKSLALARVDEDERIIQFVDSLSDEVLDGSLQYSNSSGRRFEQKLRDILSHLFNHQTHHRGQAHTIISICTRREPPTLDLLGMQRGNVAQELREMANQLG
jgi:uncharacterized damage-inducible protein DinB